MGGNKEADPEREKKRKKALKRMVKMVGKAWSLPNAEPFHNSHNNGTVILCLTSLGQKLDEEDYRYGRHGWEDFARDFGGVYNYHIHRKTKHAKIAKSHLQQITSMLAEKDESLSKVAEEHVPEEPKSSKKRNAEANGDSEGRHKKRQAANAKPRDETSDPDLLEREDRALESLIAFIEDNGGSSKSVQNYRCNVRRKPSDGRYDITYYNENGRRFRSMVEVAKFLNLNVVIPARSAAGKKTAAIKKRAAPSREVENEKKKLRKELEKIRRQHTKVRKQLDDFLTDEKESIYPIEDMLLQEESQNGGSRAKNVFPTNCSAARVPDIDGFPGIPSYCIPEVLATWDFLSTFGRSLNLNPISLDDFVQCLTYKPPPNLSDSDVLSSPPVFLGEAHLGLLKLLLGDRSSDDWWWSILETDVTENAVTDGIGGEESDLPLIKVDFAALLLETEEAVITQTWLQNLDNVRTLPSNNLNALNSAVKEAMDIVHNRWVRAYLRKALNLGKTSGASFMRRAILWLVDKVKEATSDLAGRTTKSGLAKRAKVVEEISQQMEKVSSAALAVTDDDLLSDIESDEESDEEDEDENNSNEIAANGEASGTREDPDERPASYIPQKPLPSLVDLLLPPGKPLLSADLLNPACWPPLVGATVNRIIHRYKRLRNELDDSLRLIRELPRLTVKQRRERERIASSRVFSEFGSMKDDQDPPQMAADHLCSGGNYLDLSPLERLCLLRVLIDAAYDTARVYEIVDSNYKQRTNAVKALDTEQRRAKKEAKEKAAASEAVAREDLALEAKRNFLEEKREEIRQANANNHSLTEEDIDELTEEDILDFDDDFRADFETLPAPDSFKKAEVLARVARIEEAAAFETEHLTVLTMDELLEKEEAELSAMKKEFEDLGGEDALLNPQLERSVAKRIEKLRRDLAKLENTSHSLPAQRESALDSLKEAIADGTIKSLRAAIRISKIARLFGPDETTNGVWALDAVRDAHMELENARHLKRVADAQKDLVTKLNRCFTRTEPLGADRFRNRLWRFGNTDQCHVWAEVNPVFSEANPNLANQYGFLPVVSSITEIAVGSNDFEDDFQPTTNTEKFTHFSRQEYHASGVSASLAQRHWGCHMTDTSVRALMKGLDSRGLRENELKKNLKEALEKASSAENAAEEMKSSAAVEPDENRSGDAEGEEERLANAKELKTSGDESAFDAAKASFHGEASDIVRHDLIEALTTGIGQNVRVRIVVESTKDSEVARYEEGIITGWKVQENVVPVEPDGDEFEPQTKIVDTPIWLATTTKGNEHWLTGVSLLESICRFLKRSGGDQTYFETDSSYLAYQNALGRHLGKAAAQALTPVQFAQHMVRREAEVYQRLKHRLFDNSWGGKSGNRNAWISSMKDFAFDFETVKEGLLTLESAFAELTGGIPDVVSDEEPSGRALLDNPKTREDIELESIEKTINGLWNSRASRAVFLEIIRNCKTVSFLVLGLELMCRNAKAYIDANTTKGDTGPAPPEARSSLYYNPVSTTRSSRRSTNTWEQEESLYYDDMPARPTRRVARVNYVGLD